MTREELNTFLSSLENEDERAGAITGISDGFDAVFSELEGLKEETKTQKASIDTLRDTNAKLALRVTTGTSPEQPKEKTQEELEDESRAYFEALGKEWE